MTEADVPRADRPPLGQQITALAGELAAPHFPRGDLAALRRMDGARADAPAFWRLAARHRLLGLAPPGPHTADHEDRWALILKGLALTTPTGRKEPAHDSGMPLGRALFLEGFSEQRLSRLLAARGDALHGVAERCARFLAAKGRRFDWRQLAGLILAEGVSHERAETTRRAIARAYYDAEAKNAAAETE